MPAGDRVRFARCPPRKVIAELFEDVPAEEREKIVCTNAARWWGLMG